MTEISRQPNRIRQTKRGNWSKNAIFGRCPHDDCDGLMVRGVCQTCGYAVVCNWSNGDVHRVQQADGSWRDMGGDRGSLRLSHGICPECYRRVKSSITRSMVVAS